MAAALRAEGLRAATATADLLSEEEIEALIARIERDFGWLGILVDITDKQKRYPVTTRICHDCHAVISPSL